VINEACKKRIKTAISKTGFLLEKYVSDILENNGWAVINNRYYIDSITNTPRELDILAYRAKAYQDIYHYFTLLISCKKSVAHDWVFLTKPIQNRNIDLIPMTIYTNSEIIEVTDYRVQLRNLINDNFERNAPFCDIFGIENNVFAFQEIENDKPKNDKAIFGSIDSLLKAVNFEIKSLPTRKKNMVLYTFYLLTVLDGNMFESNLENNTVEVQEIKNVNYINRFIIDDSESFYRLQFCKKEYFTELLNCYDRYFEIEHDLFCAVIEDYYTNYLENEKYLHAFKEKINSEVKAVLNFHLNDIQNQPLLDFYYNKDDGKMIIFLPWGKYKNDEINSINTMKWLMKKVAAIFHIYFHYDGPIEFAEESPF
jgi:hypothetical protein